MVCDGGGGGCLVVKGCALEAGSVTYQLCDFERVTYPICASLSSSIKVYLLLRLLGRLNGLIEIRLLGQCLVHSKCSIDVNHLLRPV